jgi:uncharacterized membrane protein YqjE
MAPPPPITPLEPTPTSEVVKQALSEARDLLQLDVRIAKQELKEELAQIKKAAIAGGAALVLLLLALAALTVAIIFAAGATVVAALIVAAILLVAGGGAGALAYALSPKSPLTRTRQRLKDDIDQLKERVA